MRLFSFLSRIMPAICVAAVLFAGKAAAGEDPNIRRIRERLEAITEAAAQSLIDEQTTDGDRADVALVIGALYETGKLEDPDPMRAVHFYSMASELGSPEADCILGNIYYNGLEGPDGGIARDPERARGYYGRAAAGGSVSAMMQLGMIYADGMGVDPDAKRALPYFMDAASRGDAEALRRLEPVMRQAREWEEARPGRKANFPTSREEIVKPELVKEAENRTAKLDRLASRMYVEVSKRVRIAMRGETPSYPLIH